MRAKSRTQYPDEGVGVLNDGNVCTLQRATVGANRETCRVERDCGAGVFAPALSFLRLLLVPPVPSDRPRSYRTIKLTFLICAFRRLSMAAMTAEYGASSSPSNKTVLSFLLSSDLATSAARSSSWTGM